MNLPKLNDSQIAKLADICSEVAIVSLASIILPAVFDGFNFLRMLFGLVATGLLWISSLWLLKTKL